MISAGRRRRASRFGLRRFVAAVGARTIRSFDELLLSAALAVTVALAAFRPGAWRGGVRTEHMRVLREVVLHTLPAAIVTGGLVGFALISQAVYWLETTGTSGMIGPVLLGLLIRDLVPIIGGVILFGRSGAATLIELSEASRNGWIRHIEIQGMDPLALLVLPRAIGFAVGAFCLATVLLSTTLVSGYFVAYAFDLVSFSIWEFGTRVVLAVQVEDFIIPPLKCIAIGFVVALSCCATGLGRGAWQGDLRRVVPRGFARSALSILLVNTLADLVF